MLPGRVFAVTAKRPGSYSRPISFLNIYLTYRRLDADDGSVRRLLGLVCAAVIALAAAPSSHAVDSPWFERSVGGATQVISVVGVGGSNAKMDVWQRSADGWQPVGVGIPARVGSEGMTPQAKTGYPATPMGIYTLDFAFGTAPSPGGGLQYVQVGPNHWWDGDMKSPTYNTMQVCKKEQCPFNTDPASGTENLEIPQYVHSVVMGVNKTRTPGNGAAFFLHATDGGPTAGCVAIDDAALVEIIRWLRPGALIAIAQ
jgi:L,D-peptidoglycan transpeptidase YkuD (ErfK/YbiS/YcfS/YnhG family)